MKSGVIIDKKYTKPILDWMLHEDNIEKYLDLEPPHQGGRVKARTNIDLIPEDLLDANFPFGDFITLKIMLLETFDLPINLPIDDNYGYLIASYWDGHSTHMHKDPNVNDNGPDESKHEEVDDIYQIKDKIHCRFNIQLQKAEEGGNPINNGEEIYVEENEPWMVLAGLYEHGSSRVVGDKNRLMCSFGHYLPTELAIKRGWYSR